jgi:hypothetical protein
VRPLREVSVLELVEGKAWMPRLDRRRGGERLGCRPLLLAGLLGEPDRLEALTG